jgi:hypothetical protein
MTNDTQVHIESSDLTFEAVAAQTPRSRGLSEHGGIFLRRVLYPSPHARMGIPIGGGLWQKVSAMGGHQRLCMAL